LQAKLHTGLDTITTESLTLTFEARFYSWMSGLQDPTTILIDNADHLGHYSIGYKLMAYSHRSPYWRHQTSQLAWPYENNR